MDFISEKLLKISSLSINPFAELLSVNPSELSLVSRQKYLIRGN